MKIKFYLTKRHCALVTMFLTQFVKYLLSYNNKLIYIRKTSCTRLKQELFMTTITMMKT